MPSLDEVLQPRLTSDLGASNPAPGFDDRMTSLDDPALSRAERRVLETAVRTDPELAEELELITGMLDPDARQRFWKALARECVRRDRPAAAVLAALEFAARHPG